MYKQANIRYVKGRVVEKITQSSEYGAILFTDGTYVVFNGARDNFGDMIIGINSTLNYYEMMELGLITKEEFELSKKKAEVESEEKRIAYERRLFEQLKLKFGEK